ncbi:MAG: hypothetical protein MJ229_02605 [bacterium]|nr:hypothetical protein [bacterium]
MNKNYLMSDLMKAAIVNSLLTVILLTISMVIQSNTKDAAYNREMQRMATEQKRSMEAVQKEALERNFVPTGKPDPKLFEKPKSGPQLFFPKR